MFPRRCHLKTLTMSFRADNAGSLKFYFASDSVNNLGALIDNVRLDIGAAAVPEPATWTLMALGFGLIASKRRPRQFTRTEFARTVAPRSQGQNPAQYEWELGCQLTEGSQPWGS
jgi:hypothetical protein